MCGINGFTFRDEQLAADMNAETKHRGPDGSRTWSAEGITFGHNRLAIIDPSAASDQPMTSHNGRYTMVYNGELYNFRDIKKELEEDGVRFKSSGDTEVVLAAYVAWGPKCLGKFNGMFAIAIWDAERRELFLARDHAGIKPLYYSELNGALIFSSEIKGLLVHSGVSRRISRDSFNHYFRLLYVPEPLTMYEDVFKLPQGSYAFYQNGTLTITKYLKPVAPKTTRNAAETTSSIEKTIDEAVERQLVSDRPLGVYLSGGIDSSVLLDAMSRKHSKIKTYSVGFTLGSHEETEKFNSDFDLARRTAEHYRTDHHEVLLSSDQALANFEKVIWHMDEPISNATAWALFALSEKTKPSATVVLCGDGGDELFGGYDRYRLAYISSWYQMLPRPMTTLFGVFNSSLHKAGIRPWIDRYALFLFQKDKVVSRVIASTMYNKHVTRSFFERYMKDQNGKTFEEVLMNTDRQTWLVDFALMLGDTMSMAHGIEARVPLLDREVVDLALSIPAAEKLSFRQTKKLLKQAFSRRLPAYLFSQPKRGFFTPAAKWLRHPEFQKYADNVLSPDFYAPTAKLFDWNEIETMLARHIDGSVYNLTMIWALLTFQVWAKTFKVTV